MKLHEDAHIVISAWFDEAHIKPLGAGHIHDTYHIQNADGAYVLQRVNEYVFRDGDLVMDQTDRLLACWSSQDRYIVPTLIPTKTGQVRHRTATGLWRVWRFIKDTRTIDPIQNLAQAEAVGCAFGALQGALNDLDGPPFRDTIQGFLDLSYYLEQFAQVAERAPGEMRARIFANEDLADSLVERQSHIHGDCKVNNVLFAQDADEVVAVIDFDTAMFGHWAWDFGDLIRSVCFSAGGYRSDLYEACLRGFARGQVRTNAREAVIAPLYVSLMLGIRFLTDHLEGDVYFKTTFPGENLKRAEEQFAIFDDFVRARDEMESVATRVVTPG